MLRAKQSKPIFILVGNKVDKESEREVSSEEGRALARSFGCGFLETSAKTHHNVEHLFTSLVRNLRNPPQAMPPQIEHSEEKTTSRACGCIIS